MPVQQDLGLLQRLAYLQAGGKDPGQSTLDKINATFGTINQTGRSIMDYALAQEAMKKAELERQRLQAQIPQINQETQKTKLENESSVRSQTPYRFIAPGGQSPEQTQRLTTDVMNQPIPAQDLISGKLASTEQGLSGINKNIQENQKDYGDLTQKEYLGDVVAQYKLALKEKAERLPPSPQLISKSEFLKRRKNGEQIKSTDYKIVDDMQGVGGADRSTKNLIFRYQTELRREPDYKKASDMIRSSDELDTLLKNVYDKNGNINEVAFSGAKAKAARAAGEVGVLTDNDIARYSQGNSIIRKSADKIINLINGKPSDLTIEDMQAVSAAMKLKAEERRLNAANMTADMMAVNMNMSPDEVYKYLAISDIGGATGVGTIKKKTEPVKSAKDPLGLGL